MQERHTFGTKVFVEACVATNWCIPKTPVSSCQIWQLANCLLEDRTAPHWSQVSGTNVSACAYSSRSSCTTARISLFCALPQSTPVSRSPSPGHSPTRPQSSSTTMTRTFGHG